MALELASVSEDDHLTPRIIVIGVGGGGCNAVNNMIESDLQGVEFIAANTDAQSLKASLANRKLQLGHAATGGLGSGAKPEVGRKAAQESAQDIRDALEGSNMVFIATGMGGGTGTGAAPVVAEIAQSMGILTVAVATKPFEFEGNKRMQAAIAGLQELQDHVGTLIVIPNQNLFRIANENTTFAEAFKMADDVLCAGVRGVTDLIMVDGLVNLDFADIRTVMSQMGKAMMGTGEAEGENRAIRATEAAVTNALLEDSSLRGATEILVNITADRDLGLHEIDEAVNRVRTEAGEEAYVHFGAALHESMHGIIRVSVVATGINADGQQHLALDSHTSQLSPEASLTASSASIHADGNDMGSGGDEAAFSQAPVAYGDKFAIGEGTEGSAVGTDIQADIPTENPYNINPHATFGPSPSPAPVATTPAEEEVFIPPAAHRLAESATSVVHGGHLPQEDPQEAAKPQASDPITQEPITQDPLAQDTLTQDEEGEETTMTVQKQDPVADEVVEEETDASDGFSRWQPSPSPSPEPEPEPEPSPETSHKDDEEDDDGGEKVSPDDSADNSDNSVVNLDERRAKEKKTLPEKSADEDFEEDLLADTGTDPDTDDSHTDNHEPDDETEAGNLWGIPAFLRR